MLNATVQAARAVAHVVCDYLLDEVVDPNMLLGRHKQEWLAGMKAGTLGLAPAPALERRLRARLADLWQQQQQSECSVFCIISQEASLRAQKTM